MNDPFWPMHMAAAKVLNEMTDKPKTLRERYDIFANSERGDGVYPLGRTELTLDELVRAALARYEGRDE